MFKRELTIWRHSPDIWFPNCCDMYKKTMPDSLSG